MGKDEIKERIKVLLSELYSSDETVRSSAAKTLMEIGEPIIPYLSEINEHIESDSEAVCGEVARILVHIGEPAVPSLINLLKRTADDAFLLKKKRVSIQKIIDILARIGQPAIPDLTDMLRSFHGRTRVAAAMVLQKIDDPAQKQAIVQALTNGLDDKYDYVRQWAVDACVIALQKTGDPAHEHTIIQALTQKAIYDELDYVRERVVDACIIALQKIGDTAHKQTIIQALTKKAVYYDKLEYLRERAVDTLIKIGEPAVLPLIKEMKDLTLRDGISSSRILIGDAPIEAVITPRAMVPAKFLIDIGKPAVPELTELLKNTSELSPYRIASALILGDIGNPDVVPLLEDTLNDKDTKVAEAATIAISKFGESAAPILFNTVLSSQKYNIRKLAEECLVATVGKAAVPVLSREIRDFNEDACKKAAELLGKIGDPAALASLNEALGYQDQDVREKAAKAIKEIEEKAKR